ncbi:HET-domain-containing protein, partial [Aspergillus sclerotiicarbonarius CBS 121057]
PPVDFRLIDVNERCVVRVKRLQDYVCLSYVWGTDTSCQATFETIRDLERPNSFAGSSVPGTIKHAMMACAALGKRYLWVDRLCIIQDEEENPSKQFQIDAMGDIYSSAVLTIVALEGTGADYGLHGVSPDLGRRALYKINLEGERFLESFKGIESLCHGKMWTSRGWTYQESTLSPRLLLFTKYGLVYE